MSAAPFAPPPPNHPPPEPRTIGAPLEQKDETMTTFDTYGLTLCRSDQGDGGWSFHAPNATDEEIANGDAPCIASGPANWNEDADDWNRPNADDYHNANLKYTAGRDPLILSN